MQLEGKVAIVYGAAGPMGGAVARAFGAEGARLFLAGRTISKMRKIADEIELAGGRAEAAEEDVLPTGPGRQPAQCPISRAEPSSTDDDARRW